MSRKDYTICLRYCKHYGPLMCQVVLASKGKTVLGIHGHVMLRRSARAKQKRLVKALGLKAGKDIVHDGC